MFNDTFNNISVIWWRSVFLVEKTTNNLIFVTTLWFMVFNATFNNISVISWWSVLLVEETRVPGENH
jgi:hypothetical protein